MTPNLENFRPKLRAGRVIPRGSRIVFETDNPYNQVILPMPLADLILLCSGQFSVREIVAKIYKKQGSVPFKSILRAIHVLHQGGFFENGEELVLSSDLQSWMEPKRGHSVLSLRFGQRIVADRPSPIVYYMITLGLLIGSIAGLQFFPSEPLDFMVGWLKAQKGWAVTGDLLLLSSLLVTFRYVLRGWQQLLLTGKAYNVSLSVSFWGVHLHVGNEANDLFENRLYTVMFYASQILMPWFAVFLASFYLGKEWLQPLILIATARTVWDLNPFHTSDGLKAIQALLLPTDGDVASWHFETNPLIEALNPGQKRQDQDFSRICAIWGGVWLVFVFSVLHALAIAFGPQLVTQIRAFSLRSILPALSVFFWAYSLHLSIKHMFYGVTLSLVRPHWLWIRGLYESWNVRHAPNWNLNKVSSRIEQLPLFSHFHEEFLTQIIRRSEILEFHERALIVRQDDRAKELYILLEGRVKISRLRNGQPDILSEMNPVSIFGESALVDDEPRGAQVNALTKCYVLKVPTSVLREVALQAQSVRQLEDFRNAILVNQFFTSSPVFRSLSQDSIDFLCSRGSLEYCDANQVVFHQGDTGDSLYLILRGSVQVSVNEIVVKRLYQGSFFGEISMITNIPRTATIRSLEAGVFFKISSDAFWEVLVQHLDLGVFLESVSESRLKEDLELVAPKATGTDSY